MAVTRSLACLGVAACLAAGLSVESAEAADHVVNLGTISTAETIMDSLSYVPNEVLRFHFRIDAPLSWEFSAVGSGGSFPVPIPVGASGGSSPQLETVTFGPLPFTGTVSYTLTTAVPELSTYAMLLIGFAVLGFAGYRAPRRLDDPAAA